MTDLYEPYTQAHSCINGHNVWHYLIPTTIGNINVVDYEGKGMKITRFLFDEQYDKATKKYNQCCKLLLKDDNL